MTIDQALSEIADSEKKEEKLEAKVTTDFGLFVKAQEILGNYLTETFFKKQPKNIETHLKTLGPFIIQITPHKPIVRSSDSYDCSLINKLDEEIFLNCLRAISDGYLESTDLMHETGPKIKLKEEIDKYLPGFRSLELVVNGEKNERKVSPFVFVMGMKPEYRSVMALAIERAIKNNEIGIYEDSTIENRKGRLLSTVPSLKNIAEAAKEYNITKLKDVIIDLNRIVELYSTAWG